MRNVFCMLNTKLKDRRPRMRRDELIACSRFECSNFIEHHEKDRMNKNKTHTHTKLVFMITLNKNGLSCDKWMQSRARVAKERVDTTIESLNTNSTNNNVFIFMMTNKKLSGSKSQSNTTIQQQLQQKHDRLWKTVRAFSSANIFTDCRTFSLHWSRRRIQKQKNELSNNHLISATS